MCLNREAFNLSGDTMIEAGLIEFDGWTPSSFIDWRKASRTDLGIPRSVKSVSCPRLPCLKCFLHNNLLSFAKQFKVKLLPVIF